MEEDSTSELPTGIKSLLGTSLIMFASGNIYLMQNLEINLRSVIWYNYH